MRLADKCSFCAAPSLESVVIEAGNNGEVEVLIHCCHEHMAEMDADTTAFETKYGSIIDKLAAENGVQS